MMTEPINPLRKYLRPDSLPHFFCSGCGAAQVLNLFTQAADELQLDFDKLVGIGGVGCAARIPVYLNIEALHGIHGRTLAWATGVKMAKPELKVIVFAGDGDAAAIGGNHLIQAARRNLDVTMIVVNNLTFGMTGGQVAPTTPHLSRSTTTPYGNPEEPFDLCKLVEAAGGTFVARTSTYRPRVAVNLLKKALRHEGFAFLEIVTACPTYFGRKAIGSGEPVKLLQWIEDNSVGKKQAEGMEDEQLAGKFVLGTFVDKVRPVYRGGSLLPNEEVCDA